MIYTDEGTVKIDSVILPGVFKSIEVKGDAIVDEQEVEGQSKKPKQATGYDDVKVNIELILEDGPDMGKLEKLETIQQIFRTSGLHNLEVLIRSSKKEGISVVLSGVKENVKASLEHAGIDTLIGADNICSDITKAVRMANLIAADARRKAAKC